MIRLGTYAAIALSVAFVGLTTAASAQDTGSTLFFAGDMVRGRGQQGATGPTCVLTSQFKHNEEIVWRVRILDQNGNAVDDKAVKSVTVQLPSGEKFPMHYGGHPGGNAPKTDFFWTVSWAIPDSYPTGSLSYTVVATDAQDRTQTWAPFNVSLSQLAVIPGDVEFTK